MTLTLDWNTNEPRRRALGLAGVCLLHVLLATAFLAARPHAPAVQEATRRLQWVWIRPQAKPEPEPALEPALEPEPAPATAAPTRREGAALPIRVPAPIFVPRPVPAPVPAPEPVQAPTEAAPDPAAAAGGATPEALPADPDASLAARARQMAGGVDKQLRKEDRKPLPALVDTPYKRFVAAVAAAKTPHFHGVPVITEYPEQGIVKVSFGTFSYCLRPPKPGMGIDEYEAARRSPMMTCPGSVK